MKITEDDLFKFVFSPKELSVEKREFIENNSKKFKDSIDLLKDPESMNFKEKTNVIKEKILTMISKQHNLFELFPINVQKTEENKVTLAASSTELEKSIHTLTFSDKDSNYLIRIIYNVNQTLLYLFPINSMKFPVRLTLYPGNNEYIIHTPNDALQITEDFNIERISLEEGIDLVP